VCQVHFDGCLIVSDSYSERKKIGDGNCEQNVLYYRLAIFSALLDGMTYGRRYLYFVLHLLKKSEWEKHAIT